MCFSAEASLTVGAALVPMGIYCLRAAVLKNPSYLGLAVVPLCIGLQQISEGFVWLALGSDDTALVQPASLFFLFFALAFWPFWFPALALMMEPRGPRQTALLVVAALATGWFFALYLPILMAPGKTLTVRVVEHSIQYHYPGLAIYEFVASPNLRIMYFLSIAAPLAISSQTWGRVPGLVLGASAIVVALAYDHAFVSVWCFFAAVLACYLCYVFYRLPVVVIVPAAVPEPSR